MEEFDCRIKKCPNKQFKRHQLLEIILIYFIIDIISLLASMLSLLFLLIPLEYTICTL